MTSDYPKMYWINLLLKRKKWILKDRKNENKEFGSQYDRVKEMDKRQAHIKTLTKDIDKSMKGEN